MNNQPPALAKGRKCWYRSRLEQGRNPRARINGKNSHSGKETKMKKQTAQATSPVPNVADIRLTTFNLKLATYNLRHTSVDTSLISAFPLPTEH